jgi:predicted nucleic acid-binding protein
MPYFTYDTSVCIARNLTDFQKMPQNFRLSAIVMMELMAGDLNDSWRKLFSEIFRQFQKDNLLIVPNADDWLLAAKVLHLLTHARRRLQNGKLRKLPPGASQRLALDVLIAVSARRWKAQVVTENWADFKAIQRYCDTKIVKAAKFFKK